MQTKPFKLVAVALANKMARIAFAIMRGRTTYGTASPPEEFTWKQHRARSSPLSKRPASSSSPSITEAQASG